MVLKQVYIIFSIAGISRSCTICAAYILVITQLGWEDAISAIRVARKVVNPNYGFQKQLQTFHVLDAVKVSWNLVGLILIRVGFLGVCFAVGGNITPSQTL